MFIYACSGNILIAFLSLQTLNSLQNGRFSFEKLSKAGIEPKTFWSWTYHTNQRFSLALKTSIQFRLQTFCVLEKLPKIFPTVFLRAARFKSRKISIFRNKSTSRSLESEKCASASLWKSLYYSFSQGDWLNMQMKQIFMHKPLLSLYD